MGELTNILWLWFTFQKTQIAIWKTRFVSQKSKQNCWCDLFLAFVIVLGIRKLPWEKKIRQMDRWTYQQHYGMLRFDVFFLLLHFHKKDDQWMFWFQYLLDFCWIWTPLLSSRRRLMEKCCCIKHGVECYQLGELAINRWFHGFLLQLWWKLMSAKCWISKFLTLHCNLHILRAIWTTFVTPWCFDFYNLADSGPGHFTRASGYRK